MANYLFVNKITNDNQQLENLLLKFHPLAIGLTVSYIGKKMQLSTGSGLLYNSKVYEKHTRYSEYLLTNVTESHAIMLTLHGIELIKLPDDAHMFTVAENYLGVCHVYINIPIDSSGIRGIIGV